MGLDDFRIYCERNHNFELCKNLSVLEIAHKRFIERVYQNPSDFVGRVGIDASYLEVPLFNTDPGLDKRVGIIDVALFTDEQEVYIIEAKVGLSRKGLNTQLNKEYIFIRDHFDVLPIRVGLQLIRGKVLKKEISREIEDILRLRAGQ